MESSNENLDQLGQSWNDRFSQQLLCEDIKKTQMELTRLKHLLDIATQLQSENRALKLNQLKLVAERDALRAKVANMEKQQQRDNKHVCGEQFDAILKLLNELADKRQQTADQRERYGSVDLFTQLQNNQKALLLHVSELEQRLEQEQQERKTNCVSVDQFTKLQNCQQTIFDRLNEQNEQQTAENSAKINELDQEMKDTKAKSTTLEEQQKKIFEKFEVLENFIDVSKERCANESVHPNQNDRLNFDEIFPIIQQQNCWDSNACHNDLEIVGSECLTVHYKVENGNYFRSVFAERAMPLNSEFGIFYFEIKILNMKKNATIGLATKAMSLSQLVGYQLDSYGYESDGCFWANGSRWVNENAKFSHGDVVGMGVHLATRRIIFMKNGQRLDTPNLFIVPVSASSADHLPFFPCVSLWRSGDKIETNFGPDFKFNPANGKVLPTLQQQQNQNCWDDNACHSYLEIIGAECQTVHYRHDRNVWRSVFAKYAVPSSEWGIFYFEIHVSNVKDYALIGLASKQHASLDNSVRKCRGTFAYEGDGFFWVNGSFQTGNETFGCGDVVGCGIHLAMRRIIFTKNGQRIDAGNLSTFASPFSTTDLPLFPCISLGDSGDLIEANFGPNFKFDLNKCRKQSQ
ncbi:hypothetical protein niasHT_031825 [Heterodera trifolii]|uniref:B30.2/SPRY domain-containing protein n=1 Tax=Heterodera trifolii TaxID=157864 RepID=A0ABD2HXM0_9BILA